MVTSCFAVFQAMKSYNVIKSFQLCLHMLLFNMLYKMAQSFNLQSKSLNVTRAVLYLGSVLMLYEMVVTLESVDKILNYKV